MIVDPRNVSDITLRSERTGETFGHHKMISEEVGCVRLFTSIETLPPGRVSSSPHYHTVKEEILYVLSGTPTVKVGATERVVAPGNFISFLPDSKEHHQIINRTSENCRFIVMAAGSEEDETVYF